MSALAIPVVLCFFDLPDLLCPVFKKPFKLPNLGGAPRTCVMQHTKLFKTKKKEKKEEEEQKHSFAEDHKKLRELPYQKLEVQMQVRGNLR
jgi:hypothetical protein